MNFRFLPLVLSGGFLDSFNPCAIGVLLLFITLMFTLEKSRKYILTIGFFYILAVYLTYFFIGLGLLNTLCLFGVPHLIVKIGAYTAIIWGLLSLKDYFFPNLPIHLRFSLKSRQLISQWAYKATIPAALIVGFLVAICEFPCTGGIYISIISFLSAKTTFLQGVVYLLIYNIMFVLPLILIYLLAINRFVVARMIDWQERNRRRMNLIAGIITILIGIIILVWFAK